MSVSELNDEQQILAGLRYLRREAMQARLLPLSNILCTSIESYLELAREKAKMAAQTLGDEELAAEINSIRRMLLYLSSQTYDVGLKQTSQVIVTAIATLSQEFSASADPTAKTAPTTKTANDRRV